MRERQTTLLWIRDLIDHLQRCQEQLQWVDDAPSTTFLTETMLVDLTECRRLCERLKSGERTLVGA
jgi:hypothetical protein